MTAPAQSTYTCPYCRMNSDGTDRTCSHCGAPVDVRLKVTNSGWIEQPPIRDMARLRFSRSTVQISGAYVPVAEMGLNGDDWVYFSHHNLLHTDTDVKLDNLPLRGAWKRMRAGMPVIMMTARGPGHIAFSADKPGETLAVPLNPNWAIDVTEHRFLVATGNVTYDYDQSHVWFTTGSGDDTEWHYPIGQYIDTFSATGAPGLLLLHAPGNTFIRDLRPQEQILVQPAGLIYKDRSVRMHLHFEYPRGQYWYSSARWQAKSTWLALTGPGRVAISSAFENPEGSGSVTRTSGSTTQHW